MIDIVGRPILWYIMKEYLHYGFDDFIICASYNWEYIAVCLNGVGIFQLQMYLSIAFLLTVFSLV